VTSPRKKSVGGDEKFTKTFRDAGPFLGSGVQIAAAIVVMYFIGKWIDGKWNTTPWGMVICLFLGAAAALIHFIREVMVYTKKESKQDKL